MAGAINDIGYTNTAGIRTRLVPLTTYDTRTLQELGHDCYDS